MGWAFFTVALMLLILSRVEIYYLNEGVKNLEEIAEIRGERIENLNRAYDSVSAMLDESHDMLGRLIEAIKPVTNVTPTDGGGV